MTDYQDALVLENLDLVNWVIRTRISIPNRPLLTYDDFYAIGCEAICRAALKYQPDMGAFAPFACRYIYNAIVTEDEMEDMVFRKSVGTCFRCGDPLFLSDIPEYTCQCFRCDEDFYSIEQDVDL